MFLGSVEADALGDVDSLSERDVRRGVGGSDLEAFRSGREVEPVGVRLRDAAVADGVGFDVLRDLATDVEETRAPRPEQPLVARAATMSAPQSSTATGYWPNDWTASTTDSAPASRAMSVSSRTGSRVP